MVLFRGHMAAGMRLLGPVGAVNQSGSDSSVEGNIARSAPAIAEKLDRVARSDEEHVADARLDVTSGRIASAVLAGGPAAGQGVVAESEGVAARNEGQHRRGDEIRPRNANRIGLCDDHRARRQGYIRTWTGERRVAQGDSSGSLRSLRSLWTLRPLRTLCTLWTLRSSRPLIALVSLWSPRSNFVPVNLVLGRFAGRGFAYDPDVAG